MGRTRYIKPGYFTNEDLPECGIHAHLLFAGLWTIADKEGRFEDRPKRIKISLMPYYDVDVDALLSALQDRGFIRRYEIDGNRYGEIVNWHKHQMPHHKELESEIPAPEDCVDDDLSLPRASPNNGTSLVQAPVQGTKVLRHQGTKVSKVQGTKERARETSFTASDVTLPESFDLPAVRQAIDDWLEYKAGRREGYKNPKHIESLVRSFCRDGPDAFVDAVHHSIGSNYKGVFSRDDKRGSKQHKPGARAGYDHNAKGDF